MSTFETTASAVDIGLSCLGCITDDGAANCTYFANKSCTAGKTAGCLRAAMTNFAEAKAEIIIATISVMSRRAKSVAELRNGLLKVEAMVEEVA